MNETPLFPRLRKLLDSLPFVSTNVYEPAGQAHMDRIRLLEAKTEYLLNELYRTKAMLRLVAPESDFIRALRRYQVETFNYEWSEIVYHDEFLSNPDWLSKALDDITARVGLPKEWFREKKILDAGCGPGRHTWVFGTLGADVTAFDLSKGGLAFARKACAAMPNVTFEERNILEPLPYSTDFDLVWCYGVAHHTGDTMRALSNIARHVKSGGRIYLMLYAEPRRDNVFDYQYQHEIYTMRQATHRLKFAEKAGIFENIEGPAQTLAWFDAISSEINDLYTFEEIETTLRYLGFADIKRTMPHETMHNVVAVRIG